MFTSSHPWVPNWSEQTRRLCHLEAAIARFLHVHCEVPIELQGYLNQRDRHENPKVVAPRYWQKDRLSRLGEEAEQLLNVRSNKL